MKKNISRFLHILIVIYIAGCAKRTHDVSITAHRGASGLAPENTMASIIKAMEMGAEFSEIDVQETADGKIILLHDGTMDRTTDIQGNIWEIPFGDLRGVDAGSWFSNDYRGESIPTLEDIMDTVKGRMKLNIELKMNGHEKKLTERVVALVEENNFIEHCILTSFDFGAIKKVKNLNRGIKAGYIFSRMPEKEDVFSSDVDLLSVNKKLIDEDFVKKAHAHNKEVHVWTVNEPDEMRRLIELSVDSIITNYPNFLLEILEKRR